MRSIPGLTEAMIHAQVAGESFSRGERYARSGAVSKLVLRGQVLTASVLGSDSEPYTVTVKIGEAGPTSARCTCPYDWGGWCKHIVAALLVALRQPEAVVCRALLATQLAPLDRDQLVAVLIRLAESDSSLLDAIEMQLSPNAKTPVQSIDPASVRHRVHQLFNPSGRFRNGPYQHNQTIVKELEGLLRQVRGLVEAGVGANALMLLESMTEEFLVRWYEFDEDGELGEIVSNLGDLWAEAITAADLSANDAADWATKLDHWAGEADDYGAGDELRAAAHAASAIAKAAGAQPVAAPQPTILAPPPEEAPAPRRGRSRRT